MFKRFSYYFVYLLLVLMPLHALATANMLVCNSLMQSKTLENSVNTALNAMPCHQPMANMASSNNTQHSEHQQSPCKANCASVCANMCAMTAMPSPIHSTFALNVTQLFNFNSQPYASVTQPNLQRPPIAFI